MLLYFCIIVYILGVISAFVWYSQNITCSALEKGTPKTNILDEFQRDHFSLLYCMIMDVVFGDFIFT
jgi:hypothetical protein